MTSHFQPIEVSDAVVVDPSVRNRERKRMARVERKGESFPRLILLR